MKKIKDNLTALVLLIGIFSALGFIIVESHVTPSNDLISASSTSNSSEHTIIHADSDFLRIVIPKDVKARYESSPFGPGMELEMAALFTESYGYELELITATSAKDAVTMINAGKADVAIGFGGYTPTADQFVSMSSPYLSLHPIVVIKNGEGEAPTGALELTDLSGLSQKDKTRMQTDGAYILDPLSYPVAVSVDANIKTLGRLGQSFKYHWYWSSEMPLLSENIKAFWAQEGYADKEDALSERYYGFVPEKTRSADVLQLSDIAASAIGEFAPAIKRAANESNLDPLFIAAVIFQESRFDPRSKSSTGVRGLMQLTTSTAAMLNVDRLNPEESILGGSRYLRQILDSLDDLPLEHWDKVALALAAYNQGPGNLRKALKQASRQGKEPSWTEMRTVYRQLGQKGLASSGFNGKQAVDFVESVRYYYFILSRLSSSSFEFEHLSSLVEGSRDRVAFK